MGFKEFFILSESLNSGELEKAWKDQNLMKRMFKRVANANFPASQKATLSINKKGREIGNMRRYLDGLMGADHWNEYGINAGLENIRKAGGDRKAANDEINTLMLKVARGDYSELQAAALAGNILDKHLKAAEREQKTVSKPHLGLPMPEPSLKRA